MDAHHVSDDETLTESTVLTREEVLRRRSRRIKKLHKIYRQQYWALAEKVREKHREYYWNHGESPLEEEPPEEGGVKEEENNEEEKMKRSRCAFGGCKTNAMPLTKYCHTHILMDNKQTLYKGCSYVIKSMQTGPIVCRKPILRTALLSLCPAHFQKAQKNVSQSLKKGGLNASSSSTRPTANFQGLLLELVRQLQTKRKKCLENKNKATDH